MKVREHGMQTRERSRVYPSKPTCASGQNFGSVRWRDCNAAVWILGCGVFISFITFGLEATVKSKLTAELRSKIKQSNCFIALNGGADDDDDP